jgi:hypothetical protein
MDTTGHPLEPGSNKQHRKDEWNRTASERVASPRVDWRVTLNPYGNEWLMTQESKKAGEQAPAELLKRIVLAISEGQMALAAQRARDAADRADQKSKD